MRSVKISYIVGAILLAATIDIPAWLLNRGAEVKPLGPVVESLDVVCTGRVDAEKHVISLDVQSGRIMKVHVLEGADVKAGQPIVTVDDRAYADMYLNAVKTRDGYKLEKEAALAKQKTQQADLDKLQVLIDTAILRLKAADAKLAQMRAQLGASGAVPITQADIDVYEAEIRSTRRNAEAEQVRLDAMKTIDTTIEARAAQLKIDAAEDSITQAKRYQKDCTITAPSDGTIIRLQCSEGSMLAPNPLDPAIIFAPAGPLVVRAEVEQADLGRVTLNMPTTLRDESQRNQPEWKGRVTAISRWVAPKRSILLDPGNFNDVRTTEVIITVDTSPKPLLIGQRMVVRFGK